VRPRQAAKRGAVGGPRIPRHVQRWRRCASRALPTGCPCARCGAWAVSRLGGSRGPLQCRSRLGAMGWVRGGWRCGLRVARPLYVATCTTNYCAAQWSMWPLNYPQLLATKEMMSRATVDLEKVESYSKSSGIMRGETVGVCGPVDTWANKQRTGRSPRWSWEQIYHSLRGTFFVVRSQ